MVKDLKNDSSSNNEHFTSFNYRYTPEFKKKENEPKLIFYLRVVLIIIISCSLIVLRIYIPEFRVFSILFVIIFYCYILITLYIPLILISLIIASKTRNWNFLFQTVVYIQLTIIFGFILIGLMVRYVLYAVFDMFPPGLFQLGFLFYPFIVLFQWFLIRQPLFIDRALKDSQKEISTLLSSQALEMDSNEDGYSQRALFSEFKVLSIKIVSSEEFEAFGREYARLLGKKGIIIDWEITNNSIKLYPRFLTWFPNLVLEPLYMIKLLNNVRKRKNLTEVEITHHPTQISIQVAPKDYEILAREVTFHLLCLKVLSRVKQSILAFLNNEHAEAHNLLFQNS